MRLYEILGPKTFLVYHGTDHTFDDFDPSNLGAAHGTAPINMAGFNFTDSEAVARTFGEHVIRAKVTMKRPIVIDAKGQSYSQFKHNINRKLERVDRSKYDGIIIRNYLDGGKYSSDYLLSNHYIPFNLDQIEITK